MSIIKYLKKNLKSSFNKNIIEIENYSNNFDIEMPFLVINCDNHKDRIEKFKKSADKIKLKYYRTPCIYGKSFSDKFIYDMYKKKIIKNTDFINIIEVSISLSHLNCWLKILESDYEYGLVCEDDITFKQKFKNKVNKILNSLLEKNKFFDILYLWNGNWAKTKSKLKKVLKINNELDIRQESDQFNAGAVCYIISKKAIRKLLKDIFPIKEPIDVFMGKYYKKLKIYSLFMKENKKKNKDISPLFISGKWDDKVEHNESQSTQDYEMETIKDVINRNK